MVLTYFDDAKFNKLIIIAFPCAHLGQTSMHLVNWVWPTSTLYWWWGGRPAEGWLTPLSHVGSCCKCHQSIPHHRISIGELWFAQFFFDAMLFVDNLYKSAPVRYTLYWCQSEPCIAAFIILVSMHDYNHFQPLLNTLVYIYYHVLPFYDLIPIAMVHS